MTPLTIEHLCHEAELFAKLENQHSEPTLFGVTDGKAVGTYLEHKFRTYLKNKQYEFVEGNSASGIDFPNLHVDMKVTSIRQPQSSCPFKSARQKIYGLGYSLIIFVYDKTDNQITRSATLKITNVVFVQAEQTADFQITKGLRDIIANEGNNDDLMAYLIEKNLPIDDIGLNLLVNDIQHTIPAQGYLTISNALQWRLQYTRVIEKAGIVDGVLAIFQETHS